MNKCDHQWGDTIETHCWRIITHWTVFGISYVQCDMCKMKFFITDRQKEAARLYKGVKI